MQNVGPLDKEDSHANESRSETGHHRKCDSQLTCYLLEPIIRIVLRISAEIASLTGRAYFDRNFAQAAMLEERNFGFYGFMIIGTLFTLAALYISMVLVKRPFRTLSPEEKGKEKQPSFFPRKTLSVAILVLALINAVMFSGVLAGNKLQLSLTSSFQQHMRIIAPYLDEQQEEELFSKWSQMQTEEDYRIIMQELMRIFDENSLQLPRNVLYSIDTI